MARIDALGHIMRTASHVIEGRFSRGDERTFSRSVGFRTMPQRLKNLRALCADHISPAIVEADGREDAEQYALTFQFTPDFDEVD